MTDRARIPTWWENALTVKDAAEILDVNPRTVWLYISQGKLKAQHVGPPKRGATRIPKREFDRFKRERDKQKNKTK